MTAPAEYIPFPRPAHPGTSVNTGPLSDISRPPASRLHALVEDAAREAGVSIAVILGPRRQRPIVLARQRAMRRAFEEGFSSTQIGRVFNRDHSTVLYAAGVLSSKSPSWGLSACERSREERAA